MHILIGEKRYDFSALNRASLLDLIELKKQTGLTMGLIGEMYVQVAERAQGEKGYSPINDETGLLLFAVIIWLARRADGEIDLQFRDSASMPLTELQIVNDADDDAEDAEEEPDPSSPRSGSGPAASAAPARPGRSRSTTSKRPSTSTSSASRSSGRASRR